MNTILTFLTDNWQRLGLDEYRIPRELTSLLITPRFRASSHVVFLLLPAGRPTPVLVAKMPRLGGASASIAREAKNLGTIQASRLGGFDSIPRLITFEEYGGRPLLLETALTGRPMTPAMIRDDLHNCCHAVIHWLLDIQRPLSEASRVDSDWFERLVERPLRRFESALPVTAEEAALLEETRKLIAPLSRTNLPLLFEHGDLSHPNIFLSDGNLGVVDWEMANPYGLPAYDLFFFLTYAAFAQRQARSSSAYLSAFGAAFFGRSAWSAPYVAYYCKQIGLPSSLLTPLFVLCWVRYLVNLLNRLEGGREAPGPVSPETAAWLRGNRYYKLWQFAVSHSHELHWELPPVKKTRKP